MSTKSLIDYIKPRAKGWSRNSILSLIQEGQDMFFDYDSAYMHFVSTDNKGYPPYLLTTADTYRYNVVSANLSATLTKTIGGTDYDVRCREVVRVLVDTSVDYDYNRTWVGEPFVWTFSNPYRTDTDRTMMAQIPINQSPALEDTSAYIEFLEDPGTSTEIYFIDFLWEPPRLTAETIPLVVPKLYEIALRDYVIGTIQLDENGKQSDRLTKFEQYWIPKFRTEVIANTPGFSTTDAEIRQF